MIILKWKKNKAHFLCVFELDVYEMEEREERPINDMVLTIEGPDLPQFVLLLIQRAGLYISSPVQQCTRI